MSDLLVLSAADVHAVLSYPDCTAAMRQGLTALATGAAQQPLRSIFGAKEVPGLVALMPSYQAAPPAYGLKALVITPSNPAAGLDAHQGVVLLSDGLTGEPRAVLNASAVTEIRTAAVSVLATQLLARPGAATLAVVGAGVQARAHVEAFRECLGLAEIRVASRDAAKASQLAATLGVRACPTVQEAVTGADIVVTATSSAQPVLRRDWIAPGAHINAVGACLPHTRELDTATVADAVLVTDRRDSLLAEAGDYLLAAADGAVGPDHVRAELGELLTGAPGRASDDEITIFESLGLAVEDLAAAAVAYQTALDRRDTDVEIGTWVAF